MGAPYRGRRAIAGGLGLAGLTVMLIACGDQQQDTDTTKTVTVTDHTEATTLRTTTAGPKSTGKATYTPPPTTSGPTPTTTTLVGTPTTTPTPSPTPTTTPDVPTDVPTNDAPTPPAG